MQASGRSGSLPAWKAIVSERYVLSTHVYQGPGLMPCALSLSNNVFRRGSKLYPEA